MQLLEDTARKLQDVKISALFQQEVNLLLVVSALRHRQQGKTPVLPIGGLGVGGHLRRYWNQPDFNLGGRFPWLGELRELLEQGRVLELERQIDQIRWKFADSASQMNPFTFEAVVAYVGKWDILYRWSQTGEAAGLQRFNELIDQVLEKA
ncbi:DUF2764 family protein [Leptolyngbya sp. FACHB-261]|uniref:DUF2764 family protein n=1 Tax=Leptolyngbya sp. FACHB-261 TaxID=2692806 RepID=UPI0016863FD9|nr:DUF2764 family protein [Leptolyngbya sp. FACHB-261]MBD2105221.1 DUF2764 family protein [Leptolyngbya sp. FACHB-261]